MTLGQDPKTAYTASQKFQAQIHRIHEAQAAGRRGEARVAWMSAYGYLDAAFGPDGPAVWQQALTNIQFDPLCVASPAIGSLPTLHGAPFEVFEDFVIFGEQALDASLWSRIDVFQDGQVQVTVANVANRKGRIRAVQHTHDLRTAAIQLSGTTGTLWANIHPDSAGNAHGIAAHFNARMQSQAAVPATAAEIRELVESITNARGQSAAEKIQQLDHLRYNRLLSDDEWSRAKQRILTAL